MNRVPGSQCPLIFQCTHDVILPGDVVVVVVAAVNGDVIVIAAASALVFLFRML